MKTLRVLEAHFTASMKASFLGISVYQYLLALIFILGGFTLRRVAERVLDRLAKAAAKTKSIWDDLLIETVRKPLPYGFILLGIFLALNVLPVPSEPVDIRRFLAALLRSATVLFAIWVGVRLLDRIFEIWAEKAKKTENTFDDMLIPILQKSGKVFLVIIGGILFLQNMGYSVGSLLAGFGLGGAAVALAAKDSLSNLFGSIVIFMDRPFRIGDWIEMDGLEGTVEEIGLRTAKVRTFANSLMTVPNSKFTTGVINNWSRMKKRRIKMTIGVTYDTTAEQMEAAVQRIREIIDADENIRSDFYLVNFDGFGAFSLDIFIYCFTKTTNWAEFLDAKEKFMLEILRELKKMGLEFAFPTQTLHMGSPVKVLSGKPQG